MQVRVLEPRPLKGPKSRLSWARSTSLPNSWNLRVFLNKPEPCIHQ